MLEEGDTVTQEIETEHIGEGHIDTITETITYKANTFCCFLNLPGSVHSVTPRTPMPTVERRSVNIIAEFNAKIGKKMYNQSLI